MGVCCVCRVCRVYVSFKTIVFWMVVGVLRGFVNNWVLRHSWRCCHGSVAAFDGGEGLLVVWYWL